MPQAFNFIGTITIGEETKICAMSGQASIPGPDPGYGIPGPPYPRPPGQVWPDPGPLPHPEHPIAPGGRPGVWPDRPEIWPRPGRPAHPIELPPGEPPIDPPTEPPTVPADPNWVWGYVPGMGWRPVYVPGPGQPGPKG